MDVMFGCYCQDEQLMECLLRLEALAVGLSGELGCYKKFLKKMNVSNILSFLKVLSDNIMQAWYIIRLT